MVRRLTAALLAALLLLPYTPALPADGEAADDARRARRCVNHCDKMRFYCDSGGGSRDACDRGREACMQRCMGKGYDENAARERHEAEKRVIPDDPDRQ